FTRVCDTLWPGPSKRRTNGYCRVASQHGPVFTGFRLSRSKKTASAGMTTTDVAASLHGHMPLPCEGRGIHEEATMIKPSSIGFAAALVCAICLSASHPSAAQDWPNRPVKVVVPFAAAGTTDRMGRLIADELSKTFKQQFYVENRAGGGGVIAAL